MNSPVASATFNVAGPTSPGTAVALGTINISSSKLVFGGSGANIGIKFTPSATPPSGYSKTWVYVQLIDSLTIQLTGSTSHTCTGSGLDANYPYPPVTSTYTDDNPSVTLSTSYTEESDSMSAHMYVLWSSGLTNSIPVPLGYVSWSWYGDAKYTSGAWHLQSSSTRSANTFQASTSYPAWTTYYSKGSKLGPIIRTVLAPRDRATPTQIFFRIMKSDHPSFGSNNAEGESRVGTSRTDNWPLLGITKLLWSTIFRDGADFRTVMKRLTTSSRVTARESLSVPVGEE